MSPREKLIEKQEHAVHVDMLIMQEAITNRIEAAMLATQRLIAEMGTDAEPLYIAMAEAIVKPLQEAWHTSASIADTASGDVSLCIKRVLDEVDGTKEAAQ